MSAGEDAAFGVVEAVAEFSIDLDLPVDVVFIIHSNWLLLHRSFIHFLIRKGNA